MNEIVPSDVEIFKAYQRINKVLADIERGINSKTAHSDLLEAIRYLTFEPVLFQKVVDKIFEAEFNNFDDHLKLEFLKLLN